MASVHFSSSGKYEKGNLRALYLTIREPNVQTAKLAENKTLVIIAIVAAVGLVVVETISVQQQAESRVCGFFSKPYFRSGGHCFNPGPP